MGKAIQASIIYVVPAGLEQVAEIELNGKKLIPGYISVDYYTIKDAIKTIYTSRAYYRALLKLNAFQLVKLDEDNLKEAVASIRWQDIIPPETSFACRCTRRGQHPFTSMDVERWAGSVIIDKAKDVRVDLTSPQTIVRLILFNSLLIVTIDLTGLSGMHKRRYRVYSHPAALNPVLAYYLIRISEWEPQKGLLIDPMCGGGTILIEACLWSKNVPAGFFKKHELAFISLPLFSEHRREIMNTISQCNAQIKECSGCILGFDVSPKAIEGAIANIERANCNKCITLLIKDASNMAKFINPGIASAIVTNPPYGIRLGSPKKARKSHTALLHFMESAGNNRTTAVIIMPNISTISDLLSPRWELSRLYETFSGDLKVQIGVFKCT